jgi:hypothetical protein
MSSQLARQGGLLLADIVGLMSVLFIGSAIGSCTHYWATIGSPLANCSGPTVDDLRSMLPPAMGQYWPTIVVLARMTVHDMTWTDHLAWHGMTCLFYWALLYKTFLKWSTPFDKGFMQTSLGSSHQRFVIFWCFRIWIEHCTIGLNILLC